MTARLSVVGCVALACVVLTGCGGGGPGPPGGDGPPLGAPGGGQTISLGTLQVGVASAAGFKTLTLPSPSYSPVAFTTLYGSKITKLSELGYGKIAFYRKVGGNREILTMNADGTGQTNLTNHAAHDWNPDWSPDGTKIAFHRGLGNGCEIYVMNSNGAGQTRLTTNSSSDVTPAWSPDGQKIAFAGRRGGNYEICVMNANGTGEVNLTNDPGDDVDPAWSPDGKSIAFVSDRYGDDEIYVMEADGAGIPVQLTSNTTSDRRPEWAPDGSRIAFARRRGGQYEIYTMDPIGLDERRLTTTPTDDDCPSFLPNGRKIVFEHLATVERWIEIMNADGSGRARVARDGASPDVCPVATTNRTLIGGTGSDGGSDPPFGSSRPLAIVGVTKYGLVSAATIDVPLKLWSGIKPVALTNTGRDLAGVRITASRINTVLEDAGRGIPPRKWQLNVGRVAPGAVLIFFAADTGQIASVIASMDTTLDGATGADVAESSGGRVVLQGDFVGAYSAGDPDHSLIQGQAHQVVLDSRTGEVVSAE